jgi:hypothetical protein
LGYSPHQKSHPSPEACATAEAKEKESGAIRSMVDRFVRRILGQRDASVPSDRGWLPLGSFFILVFRGWLFRIGTYAEKF